MLRDRIGELKDRWKKEGRLKTLSAEETYSITKRINDGMSIVRMDYRKREAQSIIESREIYFTCQLFPDFF